MRLNQMRRRPHRALTPLTCGLAGLLLAGLLHPSAAAAQQERIDSPYRFLDRGLRLGLFSGHIDANRGVIGIGAGSSAVTGLRLRARVSSPLSFELSLGFGSTDLFVLDPRLETFPQPVDTLDTNWLLISANFQIALTGSRTIHGVQPYILFGFGLLKGVGEDVSELLADPAEAPFRFNIGSSPVFTFGTGVEWHVAERLGITFELRDHLWRIKTPEGFFRLDVLALLEDLDGPVPQESEWTNNLELSAGLFYYF